VKVLYQWALKDPTQWQQIDVSQWASLPKRPIPKPGELGAKTNQPGWIFNVCVQGITFAGYDHIAIEPINIGLDEGVKVTAWNDDPDEFILGERNASVWTILPITSDPQLGMAINTRQSCIKYLEGNAYNQALANTVQNTTVRPWDDFIPPPETITQHGIWIENTKMAEHLNHAPQSEWSWMHWNEHLPDSECELDKNGRRVLKEQRKQGRYKQAEHTITYYQRDTNRAVGYQVYTNEDALELTTAGSATETATIGPTLSAFWSFTTPANEPNSADWPNGTYRYQLNCTAVGADIVYGGSPSIFQDFGRVSADLTTRIQSTPAAQDSVSGTGLKLFTVSWDPSAGSASDCFSFVVSCTNNASMKDEDITLTLNTTDSFADGPWTGGAPSTVVKDIIGSGIISFAR
jgi:hypothetical protein